MLDCRIKSWSTIHVDEENCGSKVLARLHELDSVERESLRSTIVPFTNRLQSRPVQSESTPLCSNRNFKCRKLRTCHIGRIEYISPWLVDHTPKAFPFYPTSAHPILERLPCLRLQQRLCKPPIRKPQILPSNASKLTKTSNTDRFSLSPSPPTNPQQSVSTP